MTNDRLKYCKVCAHQKFDLEQGILCGLTQQKPSFTGTCEQFQESTKLKKELTSEMDGFEDAGELANKGKRFANYIIDLIGYYLFSLIFGVFLGILLMVFFPNALGIFLEENTLVELTLGLVVGVIFYTTLEAATGRTPGKIITGTKVVDREGNKPGFRTILLRSLCRFIPFDPVSFLGKKDYGWHDELSETRVVMIRKSN